MVSVAVSVCVLRKVFVCLAQLLRGAFNVRRVEDLIT